MPGHLPPSLEALMQQDQVLVCLLLKIEFPLIDPLCLLYGSGSVVYAGDTYVGLDERFGSLSSLDPPEDGAGDTAPQMGITLTVPDDASAAMLASPLYQGAPVKLWITAIDGAGALAEPYILFDGQVDRPVLNSDGKNRTVEFDCSSVFEKLFADTEGQRLAHASHKRIWPGEDGFLNVTGIVKKILWGPGERPGIRSAAPQLGAQQYTGRNENPGSDFSFR